MKKVTTLFVVLCFSLAIKAQRIYFVYLQTENQQPFFVKLDEKIITSTNSGYLVISRLRDSTYNFIVGFPGKKWPDQKFSININRKDHGYLLKNFNEKGWGLFDLQTYAVQMSAFQPPRSDIDFAVSKISVDPFTEMLAKAADDPALLQKSLPKVQEKKSEPLVNAVMKKDDGKKEELKKDDVKKEDVKEPAVALSTEKKNDMVVTPEKTAEKTEVVVDRKAGTDKKEDIKDPPVAISTEKKNDVVIVPEKSAEKSEVVVDRTAGSEKKGNVTDKKDDTVDKKVDKKGENKEQVAEKKAEVVRTESPPQTKTVIKDVKEEPAVDKSFQRSKVTRRSESSTTEGFGLVFIDESADGKKDTIRILIPRDNRASLASETKTDPKQGKKFLDITNDTSTAKDVAVTKKETVPANDKGVVKSIQMNSCNQQASEADFFKLRKRMAAQNSEPDFLRVLKKKTSQNNDDYMIAEAKKFFKLKCFTTEQIKNLSVLFLTNEGKYKFFDASYGHISDLENFPSLQSELKDDDYYIKRFKAIIPNNPQ